ncbi:glutamyl-tRNA reductase [Spelaeicoccus albus]|uniref:Glutamyl-tRNA reductase n=1 Tax=Spelaeicoccus albus TaxID=1280376 RepID=A0A7Z0D5Q1_9MICO|nr:glutamyl-tRNA reductase [Spelaeicoccus albus]NYI69390.1 glutamyl-tRNA reductase [Spelaeicoccus albus]
MTALIVGLSHHSAPIGVLESAALGATRAEELAGGMLAGEYVDGALVVSTCNRLELIADVTSFHGGLADLGGALVDALAMDWTSLTDHLYVHYDEAAVRHVFSVACGLDSMALGEAQILGQLRTTLARATSAGHVSSNLSRLMQTALRVGKRAHAETDLDQVARSMLDDALEPAPNWIGDLSGAHALVLGAGAMSGLVTAELARSGVKSITVANRTLARAERLAAGVGGRAVPMTGEILDAELPHADLVVACTGARTTVISADRVARADRPDRQFFVDLALPRDIDEAVGELPGVQVVGLRQLSELIDRGADSPASAALIRADEIVAEEVERFLSAKRSKAALPTVIALRKRAQRVLDAEMERLNSRLSGVDEHVLTEVRTSLNRMADKLMHTPTVRVKQLASQPGGSGYADALRALFDLKLDQPDSDTAAGQSGGHSLTAPDDTAALNAMPSAMFDAGALSDATTGPGEER